jgi:hypothetical protein
MFIHEPETQAVLLMAPGTDLTDDQLERLG